MPVYEYQCVEQGHRFDLQQPVGAAPPACPVCGSAARKVYSSVGLIFKGSGFHVTDYRRPGGEGKTDGKPEGKSAQTPAGKEDGKGGTPAPGAAESGTAKSTSTKATDA